MLRDRSKMLSDYYGEKTFLYGLEQDYSDKKLGVFGCGSFGIKTMKELENRYPKVEKVFIDNNKQGECNNYKIVPLDGLDYDKIIIGSVNYYQEILDQLLESGIRPDRIVIPVEVLKKELDKKYKVLGKRVPQKRLEFLVELAEHCNLNCKHCDHFSPIAKPVFTDINEYEKDIKRISELFVGEYELYAVKLEGGEPLLNENVLDYVEVTHKYLPNTEIKIYTNGTLLGKKDELFWDTCRRHDVRLMVTKYPIKFDYDSIKKKADEESVELVFWSGGITQKELYRKPINIRGDSDIDDSYDKCYMGNDSCTMLKHGKIYLCTFAPCVEYFNNYFNQEIKITEKDYVDIYKVNSAKDIMDYMCRPIPCCAYCQPDKWTYGHVWETSQKAFEEWCD